MFFSPDEVASTLGVHRRTVYRWLHGGKLPAIHAGAQWRIDLVDLERFLEPQGYPFDAARWEALARSRAASSNAARRTRTPHHPVPTSPRSESREPAGNTAALELLDRLYAASSLEDGVEPPQPSRFTARTVNAG